MGKFPLYVRKHPYFPMEMPITLSVDKKAGFSAFSTGKKKKTGLIHSYPQLLTVIPRSLWKTFKPCPREMYPLYWTPSKEGTFCVIRLNLS